MGLQMTVYRLEQLKMVMESEGRIWLVEQEKRKKLDYL